MRSNFVTCHLRRPIHQLVKDGAYERRLTQHEYLELCILKFESGREGLLQRPKKKQRIVFIEEEDDEDEEEEFTPDMSELPDDKKEMFR